jgi:protein gp37
LGVSVEDAKNTVRLKHLRAARAAVKFVSFEPLLGPVGSVDLTGIDWAIVGGESGPRSRCMDEEWATEILDQCLAAKVAFFFKQWGGVRPKAGGRLLRGREWNQYPLFPQPCVSVSSQERISPSKELGFQFEVVIKQSEHAAEDDNLGLAAAHGSKA